MLPGSEAVLFTEMQAGGREPVLRFCRSRTGNGRRLLAAVRTRATCQRLPCIREQRTAVCRGVRSDRKQTRGLPVAIWTTSPTLRRLGMLTGILAERDTRLPPEQRLAVDRVLDEAGKTEPLLAKPAHYIRPRLSPDAAAWRTRRPRSTGTTS